MLLAFSSALAMTILCAMGQGLPRESTGKPCAGKEGGCEKEEENMELYVHGCQPARAASSRLACGPIPSSQLSLGFICHQNVSNWLSDTRDKKGMGVWFGKREARM